MTTAAETGSAAQILEKSEERDGRVKSGFKGVGLLLGFFRKWSLIKEWNFSAARVSVGVKVELNRDDLSPTPSPSPSPSESTAASSMWSPVIDVEKGRNLVVRERGEGKWRRRLRRSKFVMNIAAGLKKVKSNFWEHKWLLDEA